MISQQAYSVEPGEYLAVSYDPLVLSKIVSIDWRDDADDTCGDDIVMFELENGSVIECGECENIEVYYSFP